MNNITIIPIKNLPEFSPKHDLADELIKGFENNNISVEDNDVIVVTQKIVSKVENRLVENNFENMTLKTFDLKVEPFEYFLKNTACDSNTVLVLLSETKF